MKSTKLAILGGSLCFVCLAVGYILGWLQARQSSVHRVDHIVAMSRGKLGRTYPEYGAQVYVAPSSNGYEVRAQVHTAFGWGYIHDCGVLDTVRSEGEAVQKWGRIIWEEDGLRIGSGTNIFFVSKKVLTNHR